MLILTVFDSILTAAFMSINLGVMGTKAIYRMVYGAPKTDYERFIEWYKDQVKEKNDMLKHERDNLNVPKLVKRASI